MKDKRGAGYGFGRRKMSVYCTIERDRNDLLRNFIGMLFMHIP
jgi:hypothetical protein